MEPTKQTVDGKSSSSTPPEPRPWSPRSPPGRPCPNRLPADTSVDLRSLRRRGGRGRRWTASCRRPPGQKDPFRNGHHGYRTSPTRRSGGNDLPTTLVEVRESLTDRPLGAMGSGVVEVPQGAGTSLGSSRTCGPTEGGCPRPRTSRHGTGGRTESQSLQPHPFRRPPGPPGAGPRHSSSRRGPRKVPGTRTSDRSSSRMPLVGRRGFSHQVWSRPHAGVTG